MPIPPHIAYLRERVGPVMLLTPAAAAIIRNERGHVLLIRRGDGQGWSLPGGIMEPGERIADCAVRETREETGLEVEPVRLIGIYSDPDFMQVTFSNGDQAHLVSATFECHVVGGRLHVDGEEALEAAYFPPDSLPGDVIGNHEARIRDALSGHEEAFFR
jgi:ADP-ribose pyrophosphatase YjhB (NUDIX family)